MILLNIIKLLSIINSTLVVGLLKELRQVNYASWPFNRGNNVYKTSFGTAHRWPRPLNGGGRLTEGYFIVTALQIFWYFDMRPFYKGGHLMQDRLIEVRLYQLIALHSI